MINTYITLLHKVMFIIRNEFQKQNLKINVTFRRELNSVINNHKHRGSFYANGIW